jgi:integrase/recombinase XerC
MAKVPAPRAAEPVPPDVLTDSEMAALLAACSGSDLEAVRNKAIVLLLVTSGLRRAKVAALTLDDVNVQQQTVVVRRGKGSKWRVSVFSKAAALALSRWLRRRAKLSTRSDRLFISVRRGEALTPSGVGQIIDKVGAAAGVRVHTHRFRHRWAHSNLKAGIQERDLMKLAGWSSNQMLARYGAALAGERAVAAGLAVAEQIGMGMS